MITRSRILAHVGSQVAIEITWILEADELDHVGRSVHMHPVILSQTNRCLSIDAEHCLVIAYYRYAHR